MIDRTIRAQEKQALPHPWLLSLAMGVALISWCADVHASEQALECAAAHERSQLEKLAGRYVSALDEAKACTRTGCNPILVNDCVRMYEELSREVPTFVFSATNADGTELFDVRVYVNDELVAEALDGSAHPLDPGPHEIRFEKEGEAPVVRRHTARVGEQNRLIQVRIGPEPVVAPPPTEPSEPSSPRRVDFGAPVARSGVPAGSYVLAGVGALALGGFAYLRVTGVSDYNELNGACSPRCDPDEVDKIRTKFQFSNVALGVGAAALSGAVVWYFLRPNKESPPAAEVAVTSTAGGAAAHLTARF